MEPLSMSITPSGPLALVWEDLVLWSSSNRMSMQIHPNPLRRTVCNTFVHLFGNDKHGMNMLKSLSGICVTEEYVNVADWLLSCFALLILISSSCNTPISHMLLHWWESIISSQNENVKIGAQFKNSKTCYIVTMVLMWWFVFIIII